MEATIPTLKPLRRTDAIAHVEKILIGKRTASKVGAVTKERLEKAVRFGHISSDFSEGGHSYYQRGDLRRWALAGCPYHELSLPIEESMLPESEQAMTPVRLFPPHVQDYLDKMRDYTVKEEDVRKFFCLGAGARKIIPDKMKYYEPLRSKSGLYSFKELVQAAASNGGVEVKRLWTEPDGHETRKAWESLGDDWTYESSGFTYEHTNRYTWEVHWLS